MRMNAEIGLTSAFKIKLSIQMRSVNLRLKNANTIKQIDDLRLKGAALSQQKTQSELLAVLAPALL